MFKHLGAGSNDLAALVVGIEHHEIVRHDVADVEIDDPVHEIEAYEAYRKHDAWILVDVRRCDAWELNFNLRLYVLERMDYELYEALYL